jgi:hypothetical protein
MMLVKRNSGKREIYQSAAANNPSPEDEADALTFIKHFPLNVS